MRGQRAPFPESGWSWSGCSRGRLHWVITGRGFLRGAARALTDLRTSASGALMSSYEGLVCHEVLSNILRVITSVLGVRKWYLVAILAAPDAPA